MKKILCYLGILVLFGLAITPPVLRIALPDKEEKKEEEVIENKLLACTGDKYITTTNYDGKKISMIMIKQIKTEANSDENADNNSNEFDEYFDSFRNGGDVLYKEVDDGEILTIDFSVTEHSNLDLSKINNPLETQKNIYEELGLICTIRD